MSNIFSTDWFKRSSNFTSANTANKLNWEGSLTSKYSSYIYNISKLRALLSSNEMLSLELRTIATSLGVDVSVPIHVDCKNETSMTDGKKIIISKKFNTHVGDDYDILDLIIGLLCHESAHCLYTDFNFVLEESKIKPIDRLTHWVHNLIEDELIETKLGEAFPGYINFIAQVKYYYFDKCCSSIIGADCKNDIDEIMQLMLFTIRYPKYITTVDSNILDKYEDLFIKIKDILQSECCLEAKYNNQITRLSLRAARQIYELLKDYIKKDDNNKKGKNDGSKSKSSKQSGDNKSENKSFDEQIQEILGDDDSILNKTTILIVSCSSLSETGKPNTYSKAMNDIINEIVENEPEIWAKGFVPKDEVGTRKPTNPNIGKYNMIVNEMRPYINDCRKLFIVNDNKTIYKTTYFHKNGNLDTRRLVDAMAKVKTVYSRRTPVMQKKNSKFALVITLDESGSMSYLNMFEKSTKLAVMITEATKSFPDCELYVYGHGDDVVTYKNKKVNTIHSLASRKLQCEQNEELAYTYIINDVKSQTNLPIVVINITDCAYLSNPEAVKALLNSYKKKNCQFNCICLSEGYIGEDAAIMNDEIYGQGNWVAIPNTDDTITTAIKTMINQLSKIIKKNYNKR